MQKPIYRRELSHSYLVINEIPEEKKNGYQYRMIIRNRITGLLPCSERFMDGKTWLYYDISSRQSLAQVYEAAQIGYEEVRSIIDNLAQIQNVLTEYLLRETCLVLEPEYIYMDLETEQLFFLYYPFQEQEKVRGSNYLSIGEFFLEHVNHGDEKAVSAAYQFYKMSKLESFTIESFRAMLEHSRPEEPVRKSANELLFQEEEGIYEYRLKPLQVEPAGLGEQDMEDFRQEAGTGAANAGQRVSESAGKENRKFWTAGLAISAVVLLAVCIAVWYLRPVGQLRLVGLGLMAASGIIFLIFLGKFLSVCRGHGENLQTGTHQEDQEHSLFRQQAGKIRSGKLQSEFAGNNTTEFPGTCPADTHLTDSHHAEFPMDDISGPTVFIGSGFRGEMDRSQGVSEEEKPRRPRLCMDPENGGTEYSLDRLPVMAGKLKSKVQILLSDASVSRIHARFIEKEGQVALIDMNFTNGTFVNDVRLEPEETVMLESGDEIRFGDVKMRFEE